MKQIRLRDSHGSCQRQLPSWLHLAPSGPANFLAVLLCLTSPYPAQAQPFTFSQLTNSTGGVFRNFGPSINATGTRVAFVSDRDLIPGGANNIDDRFELFLFDTTTTTLTQLTTPTHPSIGSSPSIDAAGTRIVFASGRNLTPGNPGNLDGNDEIFLLDTATGSITQITNTTFGSNRRPAISGTGTRIVFQSDRDLTPGSPGNADGDLEVFLFDTATSTTTQLTNSTGGGGINTGPSINWTGTRIAFDSSRDLTPGSPGNADQNREIFLFDTATGTTTQITSGTGNFTIRPSISASGTRIAFQSERDLTPGNPGNPDGNFEIFLFDTTTSTLTQITNTVGGSSGFPSINATGTRIAFRSDRNLTGSNPDGNFEIFLFDTTTSTLTQITNTVGGSSGFPSINATGTRIAFVSSADLTPGSPGNPDGNFEVFLASAASPSAAVVLNGTQFHVTQTIHYQAMVAPGTTPTQADIYFGALLPDFATFLSLVQVSPGVISVALSPSPIPFLANVTVTSLVAPFAYTFTGAEPVGIYFTYAGITVAGSDPFQAANRLSMEVQPCQFTP